VTIEEIVHLLKAQRAGPGKWKARCPVHSEKTPSLSIKEGKTGFALYCFGCHARADTIMPALGLKLSDCFYSSRGSMTPEQRDAYRRERGRQEQAESQRKLWIVAVVSQIAYPNEARYWGVVSEARLRAWQHTENRHRTQEQRDNDHAQFVADVMREAERKLETLEIGSLAWHAQLSTARRWCEKFNHGMKNRTEVYFA
jgi:hypothetical protein